MENTRQHKIGKLIQREIGDIFQREGIVQGGMVTVTKVKVTKDLGLARIYLSVFAVSDKEAFFNKIKDRAGEIKYILGQRIRNQVRKIPQLEFFLDDSLDYIENIENLLND